MLAGTVDPGEGLLMEQAHQIVLGSALLHDLHDQLVVVAVGIGIGVHRGHFVLTGGHFVVLGLGQNAQPPELFVQVLHKGRNTGGMVP